MMVEKKVTPELRVLVAYLRPRLRKQDSFVKKVVDDILDRTWPEGTALSDDAWFAVRHWILQVLKAPIGLEQQAVALPRYMGETDFESEDFDRWISTVKKKNGDDGIDEERYFLVSDVIGSLCYEI